MQIQQRYINKPLYHPAIMEGAEPFCIYQQSGGYVLISNDDVVAMVLNNKSNNPAVTAFSIVVKLTGALYNTAILFSQISEQPVLKQTG